MATGRFLGRKVGNAFRRRIGVAVCVAAVLAMVDSRPASAIPAFVRSTQLPCSGCHTAWPKLNRFGRAFKENGYVVERGKPEHQVEIGDKLSIPETPPIAIVANMRPYDRKKGGDRQLRALHELEILAGGSAFKYGSFFGEVELEDEDDFVPTLAHAWGGVHPHQAFNIIGGYAPVFAADPYDTLANRHITRGDFPTADMGFAAGIRTRKSAQMVSVYGREPYANKLFYLFTVGADRGGDVEGEGSLDYTARLALDVTKGLTVGGYSIVGREGAAAQGMGKRDFVRYGVDLQMQQGPLNVEAIYMKARDDVLPSSNVHQDNDVFSGEVFLVADHDSLPDLPSWFFKFVPLVRVDYFTSNTADDETDLIANLTYYALENVKISAELAQQLVGDGESRRYTLFMEFGL